MWKWVLQPRWGQLAIVSPGLHWVHTYIHYNCLHTHTHKAHLSFLQDTITLVLLHQLRHHLQLTTPSAVPDFFSTRSHGVGYKKHCLFSLCNWHNGWHNWHQSSINYSYSYFTKLYSEPHTHTHTHMQNLPIAVDVELVLADWELLFLSHSPLSSVSPQSTTATPPPSLLLLPLPALWGHPQIVVYCLASQHRGGGTWSLLWRLLGVKKWREGEVVVVPGVECDTSMYAKALWIFHPW